MLLNVRIGDRPARQQVEARGLQASIAIFNWEAPTARRIANCWRSAVGEHQLALFLPLNNFCQAVEN